MLIINTRECCELRVDVRARSVLDEGRLYYTCVVLLRVLHAISVVNLPFCLVFARHDGQRNRV